MGRAIGANSFCTELARGEPLLIVGASARAAAMSARRAGFSPWAADLFADLDLQAICPAIQVHNYPHGLEAALQSAPLGPWIYTGALENHPDLVDRLAAVRPLYGICGESLRAIRDPVRLSSALRSAGLNSARCTLTPEEVPADGTWLVKPLASAGGNHISPWRARGCGFQPQQAVAQCRRYFQERIDGLPTSAIYVAVDGQATFLSATRQLLGLPWCFGGEQPDNAFRYCGSIGPLECSASQTEQFHAIGQALASAFGLRGLFGVDAVLSGDEIWPIEVNPRYTASIEIIERLSGFSAIGLHIAACQKADRRIFSASSARSAFEKGKPGGVRGDRAAKAELYAPTDLRINDEFLAWARRQNHERSWPNVSDISPSGTVIRRGHPIVTIFAEGLNESTVMERLVNRAAEAYSRLAFRHDRQTIWPPECPRIVDPTGKGRW